MKIYPVLIAFFLTMNLFGQNTRVVFDGSHAGDPDFNGDYISNYPSDMRDKLKKNTQEFYIVFHPNGQLAEYGRIIDHKPAGVWKKWNKNGELIARIRYKNGVKTGRFFIAGPSGKVIARGRYDKGGEKTGTWTWWDNESKEYLHRTFASSQ